MSHHVVVVGIKPRRVYIDVPVDEAKERFLHMRRNKNQQCILKYGAGYGVTDERMVAESNTVTEFDIDDEFEVNEVWDICQPGKSRDLEDDEYDE